MTALMLLNRVALVAAICVGLTLCQPAPANATPLDREQAIGYNSTVTATTAMVKLERDTARYADFPTVSVRQPVPALPTHLAMVGKASTHTVGVTNNDLI